MSSTNHLKKLCVCVCVCVCVFVLCLYLFDSVRPIVKILIRANSKPALGDLC